MALSDEKKAYFNAYREAHREQVKAAQKRWQEAHGKDRYYENLDLTRAIKRKAYYVSTGNLEKAAAEEALISRIRLVHPPKRAGVKPYLSEEDRLKRRKATVRRARYRHVHGISSLDEPDVCEVCGRGGKICMDHDHITSAFRGWLCDDCNLILGRANDDPAILEALLKYLKDKKIKLGE